MGLRDEILNKADLAEERVYVPQWDCQVTIREMTALERVKFESGLQENDPLLRVKLVVYSAVDENGERLFDEADIPELAKKNHKAIVLLSNAAIRLSRIGQRELEAAEENFTEGQGDG